MAETSRKIIWAITREQHREGKRLLPEAACSNLHLFDDKAEKAVEVLILRGHPKSEACAAFYKKMGAEVRGFDLPGEPRKPEGKNSLLVDKDEELKQLRAQLQAAETHIAQLSATNAKTKEK